MPAQTELHGLGRRSAVVSLVAAFLLISIGSFAVPAHAADDSNSGQLAQVPTVTPQQLSSALGTLAQGTNSTQVQQLLSQFESELSSGNNTGAASTLVQLQGLASSHPGSVSPALGALLHSLSVGSDGASVNANTLSSLLSAASSQESGSPQGSQTLSVDMQSLASLMQYANATMASQLLQNSNALGQSAFQGTSGLSVGGAPVSLPGLGGFSQLSMPSIGTPSLGVGTPSASLPSIPLTAFALPLLAAAAVAAIFLSRGRIARVVGAQTLPGMTLLRGGAADAGGPVPSDPRAKIEYYFARAVSLMARRGVPKLESETHREFTSNCEGTPEKPQVSTISSLYEKAKFSGEELEVADGNRAASSYLAMEKAKR